MVISRRSFLVMSLGMFLFTSCSTHKPPGPNLKLTSQNSADYIGTLQKWFEKLRLESPIALKDSLFDIRRQSNVDFMGDRALRIITFLMLLPNGLLDFDAQKASLLGLEDYCSISLEDLLKYCEETYILNKNFIKDCLQIGDDDMLNAIHGENSGIYALKDNVHNELNNALEYVNDLQDKDSKLFLLVLKLFKKTNNCLTYDDYVEFSSLAEESVKERKKILAIMVFMSQIEKFRAVAIKLLPEESILIEQMLSY